MLKKYRNTLLDFVRAANLDPRKFTPHEGEVKVGLSKFDGYDLTLEASSITFFVAERFNNEREFNYAGIHCEITRKGPMGRPGTWSGWTSDFKNAAEKRVAQCGRISFAIQSIHATIFRSFAATWAALGTFSL